VTRLAFLGPEGTFAHAALRSLPHADGSELLPMANVTVAIDAVRAGEADGALVPLENSVEGAVPATLDELANGAPLVIAEETYLPVEFDLMARPGTKLADVATVATHPHAEAQVRRWLLDNLPNAQLALVGSTAGGAQAVAAGDYDAAIGASVAGELYDLETLVRDIADSPGAARNPHRVRRPRREPHPHRVTPDERTHRPILLLRRLRRTHHRRARRRRDRRIASGMRRRPLSRLVPEARRLAGKRADRPRRR
jgi:prephenate dehydratase